MKKVVLIILIAAIVVAVVMVGTTTYRQVQKRITLAKKAIFKNEVILPKTKDSYMEVRHIVLRGTNKDIGRALGYIAQDWLGIKLKRYAAPIYAKARRAYMKKNYPMMLEMMAGVGEAYGITQDNNTYVTSSLAYDSGPFACSSTYFPPNSTTNGHALMVRDMDFYITTMREMMGTKPARSDHKLFSRNYVMEVYPDTGYSYIIIGSMDLMGGGWDGMNAEGLVVQALVDHDCPKDVTPYEADAHSGLNSMDLPRLLLQTCRDLDEAKVAILNNRIWFQKDGMHFQVADRFGNSFIYEQAQDMSIHFTDNKGKPQPMTNHPVYKYQDAGKFPEVAPEATYNTFNRYKKLSDYIKHHKGKFSPEDAKEEISLVYGYTNDKSEGAAHDIPLRLIWTSFYDLEERELEVKFYLKDAEASPEMEKPALVLSEPFKFKLGNDKKGGVK